MRNLSVFVVMAVLLMARPSPGQHAPSRADERSVAVASSPIIPPDYTIGPDDKLSISFWGDKDLSSDVVVRPDGRISLPLLNDVEAAGLTPEQLRARLLAAAAKYIEDPSATVIVKEIHSRRVFITGNVDKPGAYPLNGPTTVLQLIATAGGLREFVSGKNIAIVRGTTRFKFDYRGVVEGKKLDQNVELRPGDTVIVP